MHRMDITLFPFGQIALKSNGNKIINLDFDVTLRSPSTGLEASPAGHASRRPSQSSGLLSMTQRGVSKGDAQAPILEKAIAELTQYVKGQRKEFSIDVDAQGTPFQKKVWKAMSQIPFGKTMTYSQIAKKIGHPKAVRAVGTACGKNPIPIIIPCHRVVGSSGLGGYSGGLEKKKWLLEHERNRGSQ